VRFTQTAVAGAYLVDIDPFSDDRGLFARIYCASEFEAHGLEPAVVQSNLSVNRLAGTLRGLHYQTAPAEETKLVRCVRGALFDVVVDLRPDSPTYRRWAGAELSADNRRALFVPRGCAHGFQTLLDDTEAIYDVSAAYAPEHEAGAHYADPAFGIEWPLPVSSISDKDRSWPLLDGDGGPA
jgi:dTDP-4-dehydrorhamnose 3,5-epimerase